MPRAILPILTAILAFSCAVWPQHSHQAVDSPQTEISEKSYLIDEFGLTTDCDFRGRIDVFLAELHNKSTATGYIIVYKGADVLPARYDSPGAERRIRNHINFRNFDMQRLVIIRGGFRNEMSTQLWIVPLGAEPPVPTDTVPAPTIPVDKTFLFDQSHVLDETGELLQEFELPSVRAEREAEEAAREAEYKEWAAINDLAEPESGSEYSEEPELEPYVDERTPEEIEAERFNWISEKFGGLLGSREGSAGMIIFYADDQTYDIAALHHFIEQGKFRLAEAAKIPASSIMVQFGGYRELAETEFWVIPQNGETPQPKPNEHAAEEAEEIEQQHAEQIWTFGTEEHVPYGQFTLVVDDSPK